MGAGVLVLNQQGVYLVDADGNTVTLTDGATIGDAESILIAGKDGTVARFMSVDSAGKLAIQNPPNLDAALSTIATESKLEAVRALLQTIDADTSSIAAEDFATETTLATLATETKLEAVRVLLASIDGKDFSTETTLSAADAKLATIDSVLDSIKDTDGIKKITDALPVGDNNIGRTKLTDGTLVASLINDTVASLVRLAVEGKVSVVSPTAPTAATSVSLASDSPLAITTTAQATYVIPDGETFYLQALAAGAEGDPTEKGSRVEVFYDQNGTEKIVSRLYVAGFTVFQSYNDVSASRDGTSMVGNAGGTNRIILRRTRLSGSAQEVDAELRGYVQ